MDLVMQRVGEVILPTWIRVHDEEWFHQLHDECCGSAQFVDGRCPECGAHFDEEFAGYLPIELCGGDNE